MDKVDHIYKLHQLLSRRRAGEHFTTVAGATLRRRRLRITYRDERELVMDVMRHGAHVKVLAPPTLRQTIASELRLTLGRYNGKIDAC